MKVFITGGSGYLGRNLIPALVKRGDTVRALARSVASGELIESLGADVIAGDINNSKALRTGMETCDAVIHAAAKVTLWGDPIAFHRVNVTGTQQVIEACQATGVKQLVYIGSAAVIADGKPKIHIDETHPYPGKPIGLYPLTKGLAERMVVSASSATLQTTVLRARLLWGRDDSVWLPNLIEAVQKGNWTWINHGHHLISTCHIDNMVEGTLRALENGKGGEIYFLTDGVPVEFRSFVTELFKTQGLTLPDRNIPGWLAMAVARISEFIVRRFDLDREPPITRTAVALLSQEITLNDARARHQLGYQGRVTREQGLADLARRARDRQSDQPA